MGLSLRDKQSFYHNLAQLLRSGVPFPSALERLLHTSSGSLHGFIQRLKLAAGEGRTVAESFGSQSSTVGPMEVGVIGAVERTGRLEHGLAQLAAYFEALSRARTTILKKCAYPAFVLHFGVIVLSLPTLLFRGGLRAYLWQTLSLFALFYGLAIIVALLIPLLRDAGAVNAEMDGILRRLPLIGKIRRAFALSRFCNTYEMQLDAGVNVIDGLEAASRASRSGLVRQVIERAVPEVRAGSQVGAVLGVGGAFPEPMIRAFRVGEDTGSLDKELVRMAREYQDEAFARLETLTDWLPKIFYIGIVLLVAYGVVTGYQQVLGEYRKILDF